MSKNSQESQVFKQLMVDLILPRVTELVRDGAKTLAHGEDIDPFEIDKQMEIINNSLASFLMQSRYTGDDGELNLHPAQMTEPYFRVWFGIDDK